ncbi:MAG: ABC transporter permease [Vulcanimicrobiaceae bacterium]
MPYIWRNTAATGFEQGSAFVISSVVGIAIGVASAKSRLFEATVYRLVIASQSVPKLALAPLFTVWFGFGLTPKLLTAFLIAFFPVVIGTVVGLKSVDPQTVRLARSIGLGHLATLRKVELPAALPSIFGGMKIAIAFSVVGAVVGEFVGSDIGLGHLAEVASTQPDMPLLFASLVMLTLLGLVGWGLVSIAERVAIPWRSTQEEETLVGWSL